jgi:hypothetical protein
MPSSHIPAMPQISNGEWHQNCEVMKAKQDGIMCAVRKRRQLDLILVICGMINMQLCTYKEGQPFSMYLLLTHTCVFAEDLAGADFQQSHSHKNAWHCCC